jgi:hypothetical protein
VPEGVSETEQVATIGRSPYPEAIWARAIVASCDGIGRHPRVRELEINHLGQATIGVDARAGSILLLAVLVSGCGGVSPEDVVRRWSDALNHDQNAEAAALFAPGARAVSAEGDVLVLETQADAERFNASLPCQGEIIALSREGNQVTATFRLDQRSTFSCPAPLTVDTAVFVVEDGKIVRWEQLPD